MKQTYEKPMLTIHGRVESLTQARGTAAEGDAFFSNGANITPNGSEGSRDFFSNSDGTQGFQDK